MGPVQPPPGTQAQQAAPAKAGINMLWILAIIVLIILGGAYYFFPPRKHKGIPAAH